MRVIICIDDNGGMLFNNRRQSRDRHVLADIQTDMQNSGGVLYITSFSEKLFSQSGMDFTVCEDMLDIAKKGDACFVENLRLGAQLDRIDEITVYRWNRKYPSDFSLDIDIAASGYRLSSSVEFVGSSHEKITKETFIK